MFKGLLPKTTYFKGRQEQEGKKMSPKTKKANIIAKVLWSRSKCLLFFSDGRGGIATDASR